jgi:uncharacterized membrane protein
MQIKERLRNRALWVSLFAFIALISKNFNLFNIPDNYNELVNLFLGVLVMAGILNNPTTENTGFFDDKTKDI